MDLDHRSPLPHVLGFFALPKYSFHTSCDTWIFLKAIALDFDILSFFEISLREKKDNLSRVSGKSEGKLWVSLYLRITKAENFRCT